MRTLFDNPRVANPKVSLVLLDWNCRESFHSLDYLAEQDVPRSDYEIVWVEYYGLRAKEIDRRMDAAAAKGAPPPVDTWVVMDIPDALYYHKHLMYNVGIARARGDIIVICDSDAMFEPSFIRTIVESFEQDANIILHIDQIRNVRRDFYPFNYPSFEAMKGEGAINWQDGKTTGVWDSVDPLHTRNYGACMAAWRKDIVCIGGADEHLDYLGHVCGPYDLTFRLQNLGRKEIWHQTHYIYHSWHPGTDGDFNYIGPSDGRNMSTTALAALKTGRTMALKENEAIRLERTGVETDREKRFEKVVDPDYFRAFTKEAVAKSPNFTLFKRDQGAPKLVGEVGHCNLIAHGSTVYAVPRYLGAIDFSNPLALRDPRIRRGENIEATMKAVEEGEVLATRLFGAGADHEVVEWNGAWLAFPRRLGAVDLATLEGPDVLRADTLEALEVKAARHLLGEVEAASAAVDREVAALRDEAAAAAARAAEIRSGDVDILSGDAVGAIIGKLDQIIAEAGELRRRVDRVGSIAERAQHGVADLQHRLVHLELQVSGIVNNRIARFLRGLGFFRLLRSMGLWGRAG